MRTKQDRLNAIRQLVESRNISTQEELASELEKLGYEVTQATISRDISDLGLIKVRVISKDIGGTGRQAYSLPEIERLRSLLKEFLLSVDGAENLIVVKTNPGTAQAVAAAIDSIKWQDVLGTVGGDDTILIITRNKKAGEYIAERLIKLKEEKVI